MVCAIRANEDCDVISHLEWRVKIETEMCDSQMK